LSGFELFWRMITDPETCINPYQLMGFFIPALREEWGRVPGAGCGGGDCAFGELLICDALRLSWCLLIISKIEK